MKFDINLWRDRRDLSNKPTNYLVGLMAESAAYSALLGSVVGACFGLAWAGGTDGVRSWRWVVFGAMAAFGVGVGLLGVFQLSSLIKKRIANPDDKDSQPDLGGDA